MSKNSNRPSKQILSSEQKTLANERLMDGLLRETAQSNQSCNHNFVRKVINAIEKKALQNQPAPQRLPRRWAIPLVIAANLMVIAGVLYFVLPSKLKTEPGNEVAQARILVSSPGGTLARSGGEFALANGASLRSGDKVEIFSLDAAYIEIANESLLEIGSNSNFTIDTLATKNLARQTKSPQTTILTLSRGIIVADTRDASPQSHLRIKTSRARFSASRAHFTVIESKGFSLLEVEQGKVRVSRPGNLAPVLVRAGNTCLVRTDGSLTLNENSDEKVAAVIAKRKGKLPLGDRLYKDLQFQLDHKRTVDICLRKIKKRNRRPLS